MTYPESFFPTVKEKIPGGPRSVAWVGWLLAVVLIGVGQGDSPALTAAGLVLAGLLCISGVRRHRRRERWKRASSANHDSAHER